MKSLDEVIKALEVCIDPNADSCKGCPYADENGEPLCNDGNKEEALHYLKNYKEMIDSLAKAIIEAYEKIKPLIEDEDEND